MELSEVIPKIADKTTRKTFFKGKRDSSEKEKSVFFQNEQYLKFAKFLDFL